MAPADEEPARRIAVFAPTTQLSVTIESTAGDRRSGERVCRDVRPGGAKVVADLAGDELRAALAGGIDLLKLSDEELRTAIGRRRDAGAVDVVISRAARGSIAALDDAWYTVTCPS